MKKKQYSYKHTLLQICFDEKSSTIISGRIYSPFCSKPILFSDIVTFLLGIEQVLEERGFPEPVVKYRSFFKSKTESEKKEIGIVVHSVEEVVEKQGKQDTLQLYVTGRNHAGIQGRFTCLSTGEKCEYRSELELLDLLEKKVFREKQKAAV